MSILENIYGTLFKPQTTFLELVNRDYLPGSFLIILFIAVLSSLQSSIEFNISGGSSILLILIMTGLFYFSWIMSSLLLTFTADFMGGTGKITDTMIGISYALLPMMFMTPLYILTNTLGSIGNSIYIFSTILINVWCLILIVLSVKSAHRFHSTQAIISIVSIFFLVIFIGVCLFFMTVLGSVFAISQFA